MASLSTRPSIGVRILFVIVFVLRPRPSKGHMLGTVRQAPRIPVIRKSWCAQVLSGWSTPERWGRDGWRQAPWESGYLANTHHWCGVCTFIAPMKWLVKWVFGPRETPEEAR